MLSKIQYMENNMMTGLMMKEILYALTGGMIGYFTTSIAEIIVKYKCKKLNREFIDYIWKPGEQCIGALVTAVMFLLAGYSYPTLQSVLLCAFCLLAVVGALVDFRIRIIPNELVVIIFALGLLFNVAEGDLRHLGLSVVSGVITFFLFMITARITYYFAKSMGVGAGDVKLATAAAFAVGLNRLSDFYVGIVAALLLYMVVGFSLGLIKMKSTFPMGVQIMFGFVAAFLLAPALRFL